MVRHVLRIQKDLGSILGTTNNQLKEKVGKVEFD